MVATGQLKDVVSKDINWLWKPFIPYGKVTMIQGDTGIGKTSVILKIMADISNGIMPPTMEADHLLPQVRKEPVKIFYVSIENGIDDTIVPVFDKLGGNRENVLYQDETMGHFVLSGDEIREVVRQTGARVIIVDPWQQFLGEMSSSDNNGVRDLIGELQQAADQTGAAVILAGNFTKGGGSSEAQKSIGGAELSNTLRCILTVTRSDLGPYIRIIRATKMSLPGKEMTPVALQQYDGTMHYVDFIPLRNALQEATQAVKDENAPFPDVGIMTEEEFAEFYPNRHQRRVAAVPIMESATELTDAPGKPSAVQKAVEFLKQTLAEGPVDSNVVKERAREAGISISALNRAKKAANVIPIKSGTGTCEWKIDYSMGG